jgi:hypothetical protein
MKSYGMSVCALVSFVALSLPCIAQETPQNNPWNGSWRLDRSSLQFDGAPFSIAENAEGYTVTRAGKANPKVVCNGQPNAPANGLVTTCNKTGNGYELANTRGGKPSSKVKMEVSSDGNTLTRTADITPADGSSPYTITTLSRRTSGSGTNATGEWKEASFNESQDTGILSILVHGDSIDFKETDTDKPITCKLDGTPTAIGPQSISVKLADPHTLKVTYRFNGEVGRENTFVLSQDGQSIAETDVTPAPAPSTMTVTLHKS